jgi:hypothetical protein
MKPTEQLLDHAFALARCAREAAPTDLPFGMETAILAHWQSSRVASNSDIGTLRIFRWSAIIACVFALAGGIWLRDLAQASRASDPETTVVDYALTAGLDG